MSSNKHRPRLCRISRVDAVSSSLFISGLLSLQVLGFIYIWTASPSIQMVAISLWHNRNRSKVAPLSICCSNVWENPTSLSKPEGKNSIIILCINVWWNFLSGVSWSETCPEQSLYLRTKEIRVAHIKSIRSRPRGVLSPTFSVTPSEANVSVSRMQSFGDISRISIQILYSLANDRGDLGCYVEVLGTASAKHEYACPWWNLVWGCAYVRI